MKSTIIAVGAVAITMVAAGVGLSKTSNSSPEINYEKAGLNQQESLMSKEYIAAIQTTFPDAYGSSLLSAGVCMGKNLASNMPENEAKMLRDMALVSVKTAHMPWPVAKQSLVSVGSGETDMKTIKTIAQLLNKLTQDCKASKWHLNTAVVL